MERLSQELINNILLHLRLKQKLEFMLVCRYWANAVRSSHLLHAVDMLTVDGKFRNVYQLMNHLSREPTQQALVKHLTLESEQIGSIDGERFFRTFGDLNSICLKNTKIPFQSVSREKTMKQLFRGHHHIVNIIEIGCCSYSFFVLSSGVCDRLTSLTLLPRITNQLNDTLFNSLSNAPNLSSLTLSNVSLKIETLELIHTSLKQLEALDIKNMVFLANNYTKIPGTITPSTTMKSFFLDLTDELRKSHNMLFNYAKTKYPNLEHFGILHNYDEIPFPDEGLYRIISEGLVPLLKYSGHRLKTFKSPLRAEVPYIMKILEPYDCQIQNLAFLNAEMTPIFDILFKSNYHKCVQNLVLNNIVAFENDPTPFYKLLEFTCLVELELDFAYETYYIGKVDFSYLLDRCPGTLETLSIGHIFLDFDKNSKKNYALKNLKLKSIEWGAGLDQFLSNNFKNLRHLGLENVLSYGKYFYLPNFHLNCLNIYNNNLFEQSALVVTTLANRKRNVYHALRAGYAGYLDEFADKYGDLVYNTAPTFADIKKAGSEKYIVTITCGSVDNLIINNRIAF